MPRSLRTSKVMQHPVVKKAQKVARIKLLTGGAARKAWAGRATKTTVKKYNRQMTGGNVKRKCCK
jgi:hypothetical protein